MRKVIISSHFDSEGNMQNFIAGDEFALVPTELLPPEWEEGVYRLPGVEYGRVAIAMERFEDYVLFCYNIYLYPIAKWIEINKIGVVELDADAFRSLVFNLRKGEVNVYYNSRALEWRVYDLWDEYKIPRKAVPLLLAAK